MSILLNSGFDTAIRTRSAVALRKTPVGTPNLIITRGFGMITNFNVTCGLGGFQGYIYATMMKLKTGFAKTIRRFSSLGQRMKKIKLFSVFCQAISKKTKFNMRDIYMKKMITIIKKIYLWCGKIKGK